MPQCIYNYPMAWSKDLFPQDQHGQFAGICVRFYVLIPQILGALTGGWLGSTFGIPHPAALSGARLCHLAGGRTSVLLTP